MGVSINTKTANSSNFKKANRSKSDIGFIAIHYTGNNGDTAKNNADYFARESGLEASAHYFVDEDAVLQSVPDKDVAWHVGAKSYKNTTCRNHNSIGVEICMLDSKGNVRQGSIDNAVLLTRELMAKYGITASHVLRHYDVTGKDCPAPMVSNTALWAAFKTAIMATTKTTAKTEDDDEMVTKKTINIDGKAYSVSAIEKDGENYIRLRSLEAAGYGIGYDAGTDTASITAPQTRVVSAETQDTQTAASKVQESTGLSEDTIAYLLRYQYGDALLSKLAAAMK